MVLVPAPLVPVGPAGRTLPLLGAAIGRKLEASSPMRNVVLLVRPLPDADPDAILRAIATVTLGEWKKGSDGVFRLGPDLAARNAQARKEAAIEAALWREALAPTRKRAEALTTPNWADLAERVRVADAATERNLSLPFLGDSPTRRLSARIGAALSPESFVDLPEEGRSVDLSRSPALAEWRREATAWTDAARRAGLERAPGGRESSSTAANQMGLDEPPTEIGSAVGRIMPWEGANGEGATVRIRIADRTGVPVLTTQLLVPLRGRMSTADTESLARLRREATESPVVPFSEVARLQRDLLLPINLREPAPPAVFARVLDPRTLDPLEGPIGEPLTAYAAHRKRSLVAWLDDGRIAPPQGESFRAGEGIAAYLSGSVIDEGGILRVRSDRPLRAARRSADRAILARVVGDGPLEDKAAALFQASDTPRGGLLESLPRGIASYRARFRFAADPDRESFVGEWGKLYGGLAAIGRAGPGETPGNALPPKLQNLLRRLLANSPMRPAMPGSGLTFTTGQASTQRFDMFARGSDADGFDAGLPPGRLTVRDSRDPVLATRPRRVPGERGFTTAGLFGVPPPLIARMKEFPREQLTATDLAAFRVGQRREIKLIYVLNDGRGAVGALMDVTWSGPYLPPDRLPASHRIP